MVAPAGVMKEQRPQALTPALRARTEITDINVNELERMASTVGGGTLMMYGLSRGTLAGLGLAFVGGALVYRGLTGHCNFYGALGLNTADKKAPATSVPAEHGVKVETAVCIDRSPQELFQFWRNFQNLPQVMTNLKEVRVLDRHRSHWVAEGPLGKRVEWDAEIHTERPNELIGWRSLEGSEVDTAGSVHFYPVTGGGGTEVKVTLKYDPPGGKAGAALAWLFGEDAATQIEEDLHRFKERMESTPRGSQRRQNVR
jgi:uncharacterized membrane protein